jgi:hypothetical protein
VGTAYYPFFANSKFLGRLTLTLSDCRMFVVVALIAAFRGSDRDEKAVARKKWPIASDSWPRNWKIN